MTDEWPDADADTDSIHAWLERHARDRAASLAWTVAGKPASFGKLWLETRACASWLAAPDRPPCSVVGLAPRAGRDAALFAFAAPLAGLVPLILDPAMPRERRVRLLAHTGCARWLDALPGVFSVADAAPGSHPAHHAQRPECAADDIQLILATSGSEGEPKGVMLTGRNLAAAARAACQRIPLRPGDRWLACLPPHHIGGIAIPFRCALAGATVVFMERFDARAVLRTLREERITHVSLVPAMLTRLLEPDTGPPMSLRHALIGGAALAPSLEARARDRGWPLCVSYGMSEAGSQVATRCGEAAAEGDCGLPLPGMEVKIDVSSGRILLRGDAVMAGYANPALRPGEGLSREGWFATADLGRLDAHGRLGILGRADDMLVSGGVNIHPLEVEAILAGCPGIREIALTATDDPVWGDRLVAIYAGETGTHDVLAWCRENLPGAQRPRAAIKVASLPRNALGKIDRQALRDRANTDNPA